jgi:hypothetical protein
MKRYSSYSQMKVYTKIRRESYAKPQYNFSSENWVI